MVTGSAFWVDDDLWPKIESKVPDLSWRVVGNHHEIDVSSWTTADRVSLVTRLLTSGVTKCIVGTRHLLGEGWDCPPVNCVIDLTGIVASVTTNQVRGRALRKDPADASKVASIWDVITIVPGISGGERMLEKLQQRHAHTLGIDATGRIQAGVGRIDPVLKGPALDVATDIDGIRQRMVARAGEFGHAKTRWRVGEAYRDQRVWRIEGTASQVRLPKIRPEQPSVAASQAWVRLRRKKWGGVAAIGAGGVAASLYFPSVFSLALGGLASVATGGGIAITAAVAAGLGVWIHHKQGHRQAMMHAVAQSLERIYGDTGTLHFDKDRAWLMGEPEASRRFAHAVAELLGAVRYPRYLLLESNGAVWPVPDALGGTRDQADTFAEAWTTSVGSCEVLFARQGRGKDVLVAAWKHGAHQDVQIIEDWE